MDYTNDKVKSIELDFVSISYTPSTSLLEIEYNSNARIELEHAKEMAEKLRIILDGNSGLSLVTASKDFVSMSTDATNFLAGVQKKYGYSKASAFVTNVLANRIAANFYIRFNKPPQPCKIFKNKEEALAWLDGFR